MGTREQKFSLKAHFYSQYHLLDYFQIMKFNSIVNIFLSFCVIGSAYATIRDWNDERSLVMKRFAEMHKKFQSLQKVQDDTTDAIAEKDHEIEILNDLQNAQKAVIDQNKNEIEELKNNVMNILQMQHIQKEVIAQNKNEIEELKNSLIAKQDGIDQMHKKFQSLQKVQEDNSDAIAEKDQ